MSVWKKAAKAYQKTHRERHQPQEREHLGLLEKHKDYQKRAKDYNDKKETLIALKKRALNKNPDEFYHHMLNSKIDGGMHFEKELEPEDTPEQVQLMRTQDIKYIVSKRTQEERKINKLQARLHLASVEHHVENNHIYFDKRSEKKDPSKKEGINAIELPNIDLNFLAKSTKTREDLYKELAKRIKREKELSIIQQKIEIRKAVESKKNILRPKRIKKGSKQSAPVYEWKYERKR